MVVQVKGSGPRVLGYPSQGKLGSIIGLYEGVYVVMRR